MSQFQIERFIEYLGLIVGAVIYALLGVFVCYWYHSKNDRYNNICILALISIFFYGSCPVCLGIQFWGEMNKLDTVLDITNMIQGVSYIIANVCCYSLFLLRLVYGFKGTMYSVKKCHIFILGTFIGLYLLFGLVLVVIITLYYLYNCQPYWFCLSDNVFFGIRLTYSLGTEITDLILSVLLLILFISKLKQVTKSLDDMKPNMFNIMAKIVILSSIMIIITQITLTCSIALSITMFIYTDTSAYDTKEVDIANQTYVFLKIITCFISSLCLFLFFEFTNKWYIKICNKTHNKVRLASYHLVSIDIQKNPNNKYNKLSN